MSDSLLSQYTKGTKCWFPDKEEGWISADLVEKDVSKDGKVTLKFISEAGKEYPVSTTISEIEKALASSALGDQTALPPLRNPPLLEATEDLTNLSYLNEPAVLHTIRTRYAQRQIYTYSGIVLVAMNPFAAVPLYQPEIVQAYAGRRKGELEPHLFAIAEDAYRYMIRDRRDQTIIVSGESGAGKTVSAKYIMRYFATVDDPEKPGKRKVGRDGQAMSEVEQQILATNPIMEAFGNAKTTRNDNSSRFGKYIEILFDGDQNIVGARMRTYLLERSRLVYQPENERNYHIFYQLLSGAPMTERKNLGLDDISKFAYLFTGGGTSSYTIPGVDDVEEFKATQKALSIVGITIEKQWNIFKLLAALLHMGNIEIKQLRNDALLDDNDPALEMAMNLLGIDKAEFRKWTVKKQITTRTEKIVTSLNAAQALVVRDSVAKFIYACLFDWLVSIINESLTSPGLEHRVASFIGVLDIYGFEHFKKNSFEQFCINYANEKLQQEFNAHVFKLEQEEYLAEKIEWKFIDFSDNQPCIDLIEGKLGVLSLLDEESRLPSGSDASFAQKLYQTLGKPENAKVFKKARFGTSAFTIAHYALDVTYETEGFLEKNKDTVPDEHMTLLQNSSNAFLKDVVERAMNMTNAAKEPPPTPVPVDARPMSPSTSSVTSKRTSMFDSPVPSSKRTSVRLSEVGSIGSAIGGPKKMGGGPGAKKPTLGSIFKGSLISLMDTIDSTNVHYIRCIKPNEAKRQWEFEPQMVLGQLRACGVLETIRISCAGYPTRWTFDEFAERYYMLVHSKHWGPDIKNLCSEVLKNAITESDKYQVGLTKLFFRAGMLAFLENRRSDRLNYLVTLMQKNFLRCMYRKRWINLRLTTIGLQAAGRKILAQRKVENLRKEKAAVEIQRAVRAYLSRKRFHLAVKTITFVQSIARGIHVRATFKERRRIQTAVELQSMLRGLRARKEFLVNRQRIILLQSLARRRAARKELLTLKTEAKSVSHFKEVSYKLENKVVELTQLLQKRTNDNKDLQSKIKALENQLQAWMQKFDDADSKAKSLIESQKSTIALTEFEALKSEKSQTDSQLEISIKKIADQDYQIQKLTDDLMKQAEEMEARQKLLDNALHTKTDDTNTISQLRLELTTLREQIHKSTAMNAPARPAREGPPTFDLKTGKSQENGITNGLSAPKKGGRTRRHSTAGVAYASDPAPSFNPERSYDEKFDNVRAVSVAFPQEASNKNRMAGGKTYLSEVYDDPSEEIIKLLEEEESLDEDVLVGVIRLLKIPSPSLQNPPSPKEVLFPAHLISLVTNEMWKYGLMRESERFLANVMQSIQQHVMSFQGEDAIVPGIFWLSNVHEILSFVCIAESDILQGIGPGVDGAGREFEWDDYERLVTIVKHDLDSLEYNIYHTWMQETKKKLHKMVIPALIESQSLPGFVTSDGGGRFINRILQGTQTPAFNMDDILNLLNRVWKSLKSYYVEHSVVQQVVTELLKLIGVTSFNDLLMRRNFNSWKRAMQIQYNITRLEEWCKSHEMPEGTLQLEYLMQATKLLQLKKATLADIEIIYDVCWLLSPSQIAKLVSGYFVADYENPISPEMLRAVASRVVQNDKNDHLLLPPEVEEAGPYEVPLPREVMGIETYVPAWLQVPHIRRLVQLVS